MTTRKHYLLIGAGFSRNWDGWLATEIMGKLRAKLHGDAELVSILDRSAGFEDAFARVQIASGQSPRAQAQLSRLQAAILDTFGHMNQAFADMPSLEFSNDVHYSIQSFLARFDAIYSLNQ